MHAIRVPEFGGPEVLRLAPIETLRPGPGEILVELRAIGVNPVETYIRSGAYARLPPLPYTPGSDGAGVVVAGGSDLGWPAGTRVYLSGSLTGTYASHALCGPGQLHLLPAELSFAQGAALGVPYATAAVALFNRGAARAGETVLVSGASGGVGLAAVQLARAAGLRVFGTAGTEAGRALVVREGAEVALDHHDPDFARRILDVTNGRGVDVVLEMLANANLGRDLPLLAPGGRVLVVGSRGPVEINPRDLMSRQADIRGVMLGATPPEVLAEIHGNLRRGLLDGTLRPVIARQFPLAEAAAAHEAVLAPGALGKIILVP